MEETRENIIFMFEMYGHKFKDAYNDGSNIVLFTNAHYLIKHDGRWYRVTGDWDEFRYKNYESIDITPINSDYPEEYLLEVYYKHNFDWSEHGEMTMRNDNLCTIKKGMTVKAQRAIIIRNWVYLTDDQQNEWENVNNYGYMTTGIMLDITQEEVDRENDKQFNWM